MDPKLWKDPEEFRPERFLNEKGELDRKEYLIPFSMGQSLFPNNYMQTLKFLIY